MSAAAAKFEIRNSKLEENSKIETLENLNNESLKSTDPFSVLRGESGLPMQTNSPIMNRLTTVFAALLVTFAVLVPLDSASAATAAQISRDSRTALRRLYANNRSARILGERAKAVLVFPTIVKAGFIIGGQGGQGALIENGRVVGFFNTAAASYGLQAGVQRFGYAMFFMTEDSLDYLRKSEGWEIGTGPSVVVVDKGMARNISSTTLQEGVYAFVFKQQGLMAGIGIQGSKITRIHPR